MLKEDYMEEIISFVKNSSDMDNLIVATFIAGMQAKRTVAVSVSCITQMERNPPSRPPHIAQRT